MNLLAYCAPIRVPGVMACGMDSEKDLSCRNPVLGTDALLALCNILDVEAPAGRTYVGACSAVDAGKGCFLPERRIEQIKNGFVLDFVKGDL